MNFARPHLATASAAVAIAAALQTPVPAQSNECIADWSPVHVGLQGLDGRVIGDVVTFDDGTGPTLYVCNAQNSATPLSDLSSGAVHGVLRWNGLDWEELTPSGPDEFRDLHVHDFGSGPTLLGVSVSGSQCYRWDGTTWQPLTSPTVSGLNGLITFDDGTGAALYAYGHMTIDDPIAGPLRGIVKFDGTSFVPLEDSAGNLTGLRRADASLVNVKGAAVQPGTTGDELVLVGRFDEAVDPASGALVSVPAVARWTGERWEGYGSEFANVTDRVECAAYFDDGSGPTIYVGGRFDTLTSGTAGCLVRWTGSTWVEVGGGIRPGVVSTLTPLSVGGVSRLAVAGQFDQVGTTRTSGLALWGAAGWTTFGRGLAVSPSSFAKCTRVVPLTFGGVEAAAIVGDFDTVDTVTARSIALWNGTNWSSLPTHDPRALGWATRMVSVDLGQGPQLLAYGPLSFAGPQAAAGIASWDGTAWVPFGPPDSFMSILGRIAGVSSLIMHDDGSGMALYASSPQSWHSQGQLIRGVARWTGAAWVQVGDGLSPGVEHMVVHDDGTGPALYAFGQLGSSGATPMIGAARWNGTSWSQVGGGLARSTTQPPTFTGVTSIDLGAGAQLFVHGTFDQSGGSAVTSPAVWDGQSWSGIPGVAFSGGSLTGVETPAGPRVILMGRNNYSLAGGGVARGIVAWDGASLEPLGNGLMFDDGAVNDRVRVAPFSPSTGTTVLVAVGEISQAGGQPANGIVFWDGASWTVGPPHPVQDTRGGVLAPIANVTGLPDGLFFSGRTSLLPTATNTTSTTDPNVWSVLVPCTPIDIGMDYCMAEVNSTGFAAQLDGTYSGTSPLDGFVILTDRLPPSSLGYVVASTQQGFIAMAGGSSGNLCLSGSIGRFNRTGEVFQASVAGTAKLGIDPLDVPQPNGSVAIQQGESWSFQVWYRDLGPTSNFSRGLEIQF